MRDDSSPVAGDAPTNAWEYLADEGRDPLVARLDPFNGGADMIGVFAAGFRIASLVRTPVGIGDRHHFNPVRCSPPPGTVEFVLGT